MDYTVEDTIYLMFTTRAFATGIPTTLAGTPVVSAYENESLTQITAGITLGVDHDSVTGLNLITVVATAANGYDAGKDYNLVITTGTVSSVSVVGEVVGTFSLSRSAAAVDLANATDGLGAIKAETATILADTNELQADDTPSALAAISGKVDVVDGIVDDILVDTAEIGVAGAGLTEAGGTGDHLTAINLPNQTMDIVGNITGNLSGSVGSVTGAVGSVTAAVTIDAASVDAILDETLTAHVTADSLGVAVKDILADTNELQSDDYPTSIAAVKSDTAAILVDTAEIGAAGAGLTEAGGDGDHLTEAGGTGDQLTALALADGSITSSTFAAGAITAASLAADAIGASELAADAVTEIWAKVVESNGSITAQQVLSLLLAACAGVTTDFGATLKDPSGTSTRIAATINGSQERTAMTMTPSS